MSSKLVVTIGRQFGCGGSYLGQKLAKELNLVYMDREIIEKVAERLSVPPDVVQTYDERTASLWELVKESFAYSDSYSYITPNLNLQSDEIIHKHEADIITKIAHDQDALIVGRGGFYVLRDHPGLISIFLHADLPFRQKRIATDYKLSPGDALKMIAIKDKERDKFIRTLSGKTNTDALQYHLSIDVSVTGLENTGKIIMDYIRTRIGEDEFERLHNKNKQ